MSTAPNMGRRFFLRGNVSKSSHPTPDFVRPPLAVNEQTFLQLCSRCDECLSDCPQGIIMSGDGDFPEVSFKRGECTFCGKCVTACKTGALEAKLLNDKNEVNPKKAWDLNVSIQSNCLSKNAIVCRSCSDNCEIQAIHFQLKVGGISEPVISKADCSGCGACVAVCPVDAIQIKPNLPKSIAA